MGFGGVVLQALIRYVGCSVTQIYRLIALFIFFLSLFQSARAVDVVGTCRIVFAKDSTREAGVQLQKLQEIGFLRRSSLPQSMRIDFAIRDNDLFEVQRWVQSKLAEQTGDHGFLFFNEFIFSLVHQRTEIAVELLKSHSFGPQELSMIHDLLDAALFLNNQDVISELVRPRNFNLSKNRLTASLQVMSRQGAATAVRELLNLGADVNQLNPLGFSPLMLAVSQRHSDVFETLMDSSSLNMNVVGNGFYTALRLARYYGHDEMVARILKHPDVIDDK